MKNIATILAILFLLVVQQAIGQIYPVQVTPQAIPPYALKLNEYGTGVQEKLIVQLLLTDITVGQRQVRLAMRIKGNQMDIRSVDFPVGASPIFVSGGLPLRLTNLDFGYLFRLENLQGITAQQYSQPLPDGICEFCFEFAEHMMMASGMSTYGCKNVNATVVGYSLVL